MQSKQHEYANFKELIDESKADLSNYIEKKMLLVKLRTYEKVASTFSYILYSLVFFVFTLILFFTLLLGAGLFLGSLLDSYSAGFAILSLFVILILIVSALNQKKIRRYFFNQTLHLIRKIENDED
ncbi:MAG: hypothetical protein RL662_1075 [Bacteroidota bacterium]|jgi:ABC-type sugar transport system permease subunit